jgi:hypothetical protein
MEKKAEFEKVSTWKTYRERYVWVNIKLGVTRVVDGWKDLAPDRT